MALTELTYDLTGGNDTIQISLRDFPTSSNAVSYHLQGDGAVNGTATVKLQETNVHGSAMSDIAGATAVADTSTSEYVGKFDVGGAFLNFDVTLGTATAGIVTLTLRTT